MLHPDVEQDIRNLARSMNFHTTQDQATAIQLFAYEIGAIYFNQNEFTVTQDHIGPPEDSAKEKDCDCEDTDCDDCLRHLGLDEMMLWLERKVKNTLEMAYEQRRQNTRLIKRIDQLENKSKSDQS